MSLISSRPARIVTATCLIATALLSVVSLLTQPSFAGDTADRLASVEEGGASAAVSIMAFTLSQLPFAIAVVGVALFVGVRARRTAIAGGVLGLLGAFGHTVFGGFGLTQLAMAPSGQRAAMAEVVEEVESGPAAVFMGVGLLGTVLGLLLLGIALFRSRAVPRWIPVAMWGFLVIEFVGTNLSEWASPAAGILYVAATGGLAMQVLSNGGQRETASRQAAAVSRS